MSTKDAVTIASRALAVYMLFWFLSDLTYRHIFFLFGITKARWDLWWRQRTGVILSVCSWRSFYFAWCCSFSLCNGFTVPVRQCESISWLPRKKNR